MAAEPPTRRSRRAAPTGAGPAAAPSASMSDTITPEALQPAPAPFTLLEPEAEPGVDALSDAATTTFTGHDERVADEQTTAHGSEQFTATESTATDTASDADPAASLLDDFEKAARLFAFTGETPIQNPVDAPPVTSADPSTSSTRGAAFGRVRGAAFKRMAAASFSVGVMSLVGLLTVGLTTPAAAVAAATGTVSATSVVAPAGDVQPGSEEIQAYVAPAQVENVAIQRNETYETGTLVDMAGVAGISNYSSSVFTNNPNCPIQWPFAVGVTMSYGFGMRDGTMHEGIDFTPGDGAHIQAIADGVVRIATDSGGAYGVTIVIDHIIDGALVSSRYAHMQYGSRQVEVGDKVSVGEFIGMTGDTGRSYGAHTHFEILSGGATAIDPMPWLQSHATC